MEKLSEWRNETEQHPVAAKNTAARMFGHQVACMVWGAAAGFGSWYGMLHPLGLAVVLGAAEADYFWVALGAGAVSLLVHAQPMALVYLCVIIAAAGMRWAKPHSFPSAAVLGAGMLIGMSWLLWLGGSISIQTALVSLADGVLAVLLGLQLVRCPPSGSEKGLLLPGVVLLTILANLPVGLFWIGAVFSTGAGLVLSCRGRREQALVTMGVLAAALCAAAPQQMFVGLSVLGGTLLAVTYGAGDRLRCSGWFLLGCLPGALCVPAVGQAGCFWLAFALGQIIFFCMPAPLVLAVPISDPTESAGRPAVSLAANRLEAAATSLTEIADTIHQIYEVLPPQGENYNWVVERTQETLCSHCENREMCWQNRYNDTMEALFHLKPMLEQQGQLEFTKLPGQLSYCIHPSALCAAVERSWVEYGARRKARARSQGMRAAITEQYEAIARALAALAQQLGVQGSRDAGRTGRLAAAFASLGREPLACSVTFGGQGQLQAAVTLRRMDFSKNDLRVLAEETSRVCHRQVDIPQVCTGKDAITLIFSEKARLRPIFGMANSPAQQVSGDVVRQFCVGDTAVMLLCDGMGTGRPAAVDGTVAANLTASLLQAGFHPETAARLTNVALALKSDEESSATLDLMQVDLYTGSALLYKAGAAPGFVVQNGKARVLDGPSLPMGLLARVKSETRSLRLYAGDWAVLVSDGMLMDGTDWIVQQLELCVASGSSPTDAAALLVRTGKMRAQRSGRPDDITVTAMRLEQVT